jgi:hypothetical protein
MVKDYPKPIKIRHDLQKNDFLAKASVAKLGSNLILLKCKVGTNTVLCLLDLGATHLFAKPNIVEQFGLTNGLLLLPTYLISF